MITNKIIIWGLAILVGIITLAQSTFIVKEKDQVVVTEFGKPIGTAITEPGLKFKVPFIQKTNYFEKRFLEWDGDPNQLPTKDKKFIFVDCYARWQIVDPLLFFKRLTNERMAHSRLDDILDGATRNFIANHNIEETVRNSNRKPVTGDSISELIGDSLLHINTGRSKIQTMILDAANKQTSELGIVVLDFRFKRINYVSEVQTQVYERMKSERYRIADKFKSEGQGAASRINGEKERELNKLLSEAFKKSETIKGKADAHAASIYASAYNRSYESQKLYAFLKSMETFEKTFDNKTTIVLSTDSELYKYLKKSE